MKKLPIGIQSFEKLREGDYLYVDKTRLAYDLAHSGGNYFFLSRPRRFGKSLLLSTLKAYFEGKRDLFEGLDIMELEHDWKQHPVLHLDLNTGDYSSVEGVWAMFRRHILNWEKQYGIIPAQEELPERFANIITSMHDVVILVDEYDKPLLQTMEDIELQDRFRSILKSMYSVLKTCDAHLRFALLTGVSRFSHVSIFSDLNKGRLPTYHRLDLDAKRKFFFNERTTLEVDLGITNAYNRANVFYVDILTRETVNQLPILPSLGLTLSF